MTLEIGKERKIETNIQTNKERERKKERRKIGRASCRERVSSPV